MYFAQHGEIPKTKDVRTTFGGYNHRLSCQDGEFFDMKNITTAYFPMLSPRNKRGICHPFKEPQMLTDRDGLVWIDNEYLYVDGERATYVSGREEIDTAYNNLPITPVKMGTKMVMSSEWAVDMETLNIEIAYESITLSGIPYIVPAPDDLTMYSWPHGRVFSADAPPTGATNGSHAIFSENGTNYMKVYNAEKGVWSRLDSNHAFIEIACGNIDGPYLEEGQTVTVSVNNSKGHYDSVIDLFPDTTGDGWYSVTTEVIKIVPEKETSNVGLNRSYVGFIISGEVKECLLYQTASESGLSDKGIKVVPKKLNVNLLTECNNRLWGCSEDGHEIYATALGSWKRWNKFEGVSTDSYAVTIGSDGKFTGSVTYNGNPIFFKENSMIKVTVSATGAHQVKEIACPGVQSGSRNSICIINGVLYYKGVEGVYAYDGSLPVLVSSSLGEIRYYDASAGTILDRYYISMKDGNGKAHLFVYDTSSGMWAKEDNTDAMVFCRSKDDLYYIDRADNKLKSVRGTLPYEEGSEEESFDWFAESGNIGFHLPDKKYLSKIQMRLSMDIGTNASVFVQYDSSGNWEHICNLSGTGTRSFTIPIIPRRCDHFKYMIAGNGGCKIFSVTKTIEEGSDS